MNEPSLDARGGKIPALDLSLVQLTDEGEVHKGSGKATLDLILGHLREVAVPIKDGPVCARWCTHNPIRIIAVNKFDGQALMI